VVVQQPGSGIIAGAQRDRMSGPSAAAWHIPGEEPRRRRALDVFFAAKYEELRRLASNLKRGDGCLTLSPTALVNEAWLKLARSPDLKTLPTPHFKALAARAMRRVLIDAARRRDARKRIPRQAAVTVPIDQAPGGSGVEVDVLGLDAALRSLERLSPRQAALVEMRYFGGLTVPELAQVLEISESTVEREWRAARAWLRSQLRRA
jgi:RNA polymerase sigma-70 factor, ECF subfamily